MINVTKFTALGSCTLHLVMNTAEKTRRELN